MNSSMCKDGELVDGGEIRSRFGKSKAKTILGLSPR